MAIKIRREQEQVKLETTRHRSVLNKIEVLPIDYAQLYELSGWVKMLMLELEIDDFEVDNSVSKTLTH